MSQPSISIVVPAYNRPRELAELLDSVLSQTVMPRQVLICEDKSPQRYEICVVCQDYYSKLASKGVELTYLENEANLGYDKNLRKCIESASSDWAIVMGNDDVLLSNAVAETARFIDVNSVDFISRSFIRFNTSVSSPIGLSSIAAGNGIFNKQNSRPRIIFRAAGFVGGLVVNTAFARKNSCAQFDGSLYYQIYLAAIAYCEKGIGYIATPIVGGRAGNPPMFGSAEDDREVHVPGSYTAQGRARMWKGVLDIADAVGRTKQSDLMGDIRHELEVRQSFHIFEMNAKSPRSELRALRSALVELNLFSHPLPRLLYWLDYFLGRRASIFYWFCRKLIQR